MLAGAAIFFATPALAQEREIDGWTLNDDGSSCAISTLGDDGNSLTMINDGDPRADGIGFIAVSLKDAGITRNQPMTLGVSVRDGAFLDVKGEGLVLSGGESGFMMRGLDLDKYFGEPSGTIRIRLNGEIIHTIRLDGISRAVQAMRACGKKY